jgi:hypothetical protein
LTAEEINTIIDEHDNDVCLELHHGWGMALRHRTILVNGKGELYMHDWQDGGYVKELIDKGEIKKDQFTESELKMLMREKVQYSEHYKTQIDPATVVKIMEKVASILPGNYKLTLTADDNAIEAILLYLIHDNKGVYIKEDIPGTYHDPNKLAVLQEAEKLIEDEMEKAELKEIDFLEFIDFRDACIKLETGEITKAQRLLNE